MTAQIEKEIILQRNLCHQNIIKLYEVLEDDYYYYLVQELASLGELFERIGTTKVNSQHIDCQNPMLAFKRQLRTFILFNCWQQL